MISNYETVCDAFDERYNASDELQELHSEYIMDNYHGDRIICNGDDLIIAQEGGYLYEAFRDEWLENNSL